MFLASGLRGPAFEARALLVRAYRDGLPVQPPCLYCCHPLVICWTMLMIAVICGADFSVYVAPVYPVKSQQSLGELAVATACG
jgi:hypothetical protein